MHSGTYISPDKFVVLFIPESQDGMPISELKANIKRLFNMSENQVNNLFIGKPVVIKSGVDEDTALMYKKAIEQCGGACWVEPEQEDQDEKLMSA